MLYFIKLFPDQKAKQVRIIGELLPQAGKSSPKVGKRENWLLERVELVKNVKVYYGLKYGR